MRERINLGCPPTTHEWNEWEARQRDEPGQQRRLRLPSIKGTPKALPELTVEQIAGRAIRLEQALRICIEALDLETWDARWGNRLMHAHTYGRNVIEEAALWIAPAEEHSGTPLPSDADHRSNSGRPADGGE